MKISNSGTFTAVAWVEDHWCVAWQDGVNLVIVELRADLTQLGQDTLVLGPDAGAFPKIARDGLVAYRRGSPDYQVRLNSSTGNDFPVGIAYGNDPFIFDDEGMLYYQHTADYEVIDETGKVYRKGAPTGLSRVLNGQVITIDEDRIYNGYTRPSFAGACVAVEGHELENIVFRSDGKEAHVFVGEESFTPSLAFNGTDYLVGTWGKDGVRVALLKPEDFKDPTPPPAPDPDIPFQVKSGSIDVLPWLKAQASAQKGNVLWFRKIAERNDWGAWLDYDNDSIGLLADSSTGQTLSNGNPNWNYFVDAHLWMPRHCQSGWHREYQTTLRWADGSHTTETIRVAVDVGYGHYGGTDVSLRHTYDPRKRDPKNPKRYAGFLEYSYYSDSGEVRWEEWQDDADGVPHLVRATQPIPAVPGTFVSPPVPSSPILGTPPSPPSPPSPSPSLAMYYSNRPLFNNPSGFLPGQLHTADGGQVTITLGDGDAVLSVQPDGTYQTRPAGTAGPWELGKRIGDKVVYDGTGTVYVLLVLD